MYNEEIKTRYLEEKYPNEESRNVIQYIFFYSYLDEKVLGKDLYDFTREEIGNVIKSSRPKSTLLSQNRGRIISQYISWAIQNNLRKSNINPLLGVETEFYEQLVDKDKDVYISKQDLEEIYDTLVNAQDKVIFQLLFEGIKGKECTEIRNLKLSDIEDGKVKLKNDYKGERTIELMDKEQTIKLIQEASRQTIYYYNNGKEIKKGINQAELFETGYIIKPVKKSNVVNDRVTQAVIMSRVKRSAEEFGLPFLKPVSVTRSGMIYMAYKLLQKMDKPKLTYSGVWEKIGDHFGLTKSRGANGIEYYNSFTLREFINEENINKLYGTDYKEL